MKTNPLLRFLTVVQIFAVSAILRAADFQTTAASGVSITVPTAHSALMLRVGADNRLYQIHYGAPGKDVTPATMLARETEFYPQGGDGFILEPALQVTHPDGNTSTDLIYVKHGTSVVDSNISLTRIE